MACRMARQDAWLARVAMAFERRPRCEPRPTVPVEACVHPRRAQTIRWYGTHPAPRPAAAAAQGRGVDGAASWHGGLAPTRCCRTCRSGPDCSSSSSPSSPSSWSLRLPNRQPLRWASSAAPLHDAGAPRHGLAPMQSEPTTRKLVGLDLAEAASSTGELLKRPASKTVATGSMPSANSTTTTTATTSSSTTNTAPTRLRPYQEECVQECLASLASGVSRIGVSCPTGSGKTTIFTELLARLPPLAHPRDSQHDADEPQGRGASRPPGTRVLIIVNSVELAVQTANVVARAHPELLVEIEQGSRHVATGVADVTVATYQTLQRSEARLAKFEPHSLKAVIVDEAHHAASRSYRQILSRFDAAVGVNDADYSDHEDSGRGSTGETTTTSVAVPVIGFSATFSRHDGLALGKVFQRIVFHRDFLDMIDERWLSPLRFTSVRARLKLGEVGVSSSSGDFVTSSLARVVNTPSVNELVVRAWLDRAGPGSAAPRRSTLVFCVDVEHVRDLTAAFRRAGVDARWLHGATPAPERRALLEGFRAGEFGVLVNCAVLTEGADVPCIDCVLLARPTRSRNLFAQMVGRGVRLSEATAKTDCLVLDLVGNAERGAGVVSAPTLFGLDPDVEVEGMTVDELRARAEEASLRALQGASDEAKPDEGTGAEGGGGSGGVGGVEDAWTDAQPQSVTYIDWSSPRELQRALMARGSSALERLSQNAWVDCAGGVYVLDVPPNRGFLRIERRVEGVAAAGGEAAEDGVERGDDQDGGADVAQRVGMGGVSARGAPDCDADAPSASSSSSTATGSSLRYYWTASFTPRNDSPAEVVAASGLDATSASAPKWAAAALSRRRGSLSPSRYRRPQRLVERAESLETAVRACDTFARQRFGGGGPAAALLSRHAAWRRREASERQRRFVAQRLGLLPRGGGSDGDAPTSSSPSSSSSSALPLAGLTRGEASTMLTRLQHGAKARWQGTAKRANRAKREGERAERQRQKQTVRVGDLATE